MIRQRQHQQIHIARGVSLAEYGILFALVAILGVLGLQSLGGATSDLLSGGGDTLERNSTMGLLAPNALNNPTYKNIAEADPITNLKGNGYYTVVNDPETGAPSLKVMNGTNGVTSNVSSIDGSRMNTLGTLMIANKLQSLAQTEIDPALKDYYDKMAKDAYYLGAAEAALDDVWAGTDYNMPITNKDALSEILRLKKSLKNKMNNPPAQMDTALFTEVMPLATNVYNIANNYTNSLNQFIRPNGKVVHFEDNNHSSSAGSILDDRTPPIALDPASNLLVNTLTPSMSIYEAINYKDLQKATDKMLSSNNVKSAPVESTWRDAREIRDMATATP